MTHLTCPRFKKRVDLTIDIGHASPATVSGPLRIQPTRAQKNANTEKSHPKCGVVKRADGTYQTEVPDTATSMETVASLPLEILHAVWEENVEGIIRELPGSLTI